MVLWWDLCHSTVMGPGVTAQPQTTQGEITAVIYNLREPQGTLQTPLYTSPLLG